MRCSYIRFYWLPSQSAANCREWFGWAETTRTTVLVIVWLLLDGLVTDGLTGSARPCAGTTNCGGDVDGDDDRIKCRLGGTRLALLLNPVCNAASASICC